MATKRHRLARRRKAVGYTQEQLAEQLGVERSTVIRWEAGATEPKPWQRPNLADALKISTAELAALLADTPDDAAVNGEPFAPSMAATAMQEVDATGLVEPPPAILERIHQQSTQHVTDALLDGLGVYVVDIADRYEADGPATLAPDVVRQRRWVQRLLLTCPPSKRGERLVKIAGCLSAQLAYMAVNLGRFHSARAYGIEAFELADQVSDDDLRAWVRGTQSFCEYYTGNYGHALEFALDGQRYSGNGVQAVRLIVNGEARALGKLRRPIDKTVGRAYEVLSRFPAETGMTSCISFGLYSEARVASNAATAYLALDDVPQALAHASRAQRVIDVSSSVWSRSLVRLDTASALLASKPPDLEHGISLCREAMAIANRHRIESIRQRTRDFMHQVQPWARLPLVTTFIEEAQT